MRGQTYTVGVNDTANTIGNLLGLTGTQAYQIVKDETYTLTITGTDDKGHNSTDSKTFGFS
jgi:hypothetical protein